MVHVSAHVLQVVVFSASADALLTVRYTAVRGHLAARVSTAQQHGLKLQGGNKNKSQHNHRHGIRLGHHLHELMFCLCIIYHLFPLQSLAHVNNLGFVCLGIYTFPVSSRKKYEVAKPKPLPKPSIKLCSLLPGGYSVAINGYYNKTNINTETTEGHRFAVSQ